MMNIMTAVEFAEMVRNFAHPCVVCGHNAKAHYIFRDGSTTCSQKCTDEHSDSIREEINESY